MGSGRTAAAAAIPDHDQWVGVFLAFQSQAWHTDDRTGHVPAVEPAVPDIGTVGIVAALVNPTGPAPELETITLLTPARVIWIWWAGRSLTRRNGE